ncbi:nuclear transport factor 2 family protein [Chitinimonas koreensis]|uniref:nuclear transport factor 2 family protein n=1 Tax=Chitinimonas koreensis TaxID=356302 RepID=UPI0024801BFE|nr:nuclear transport factor 2 family protein [Chitinimonas koreensis]
MEPSQPAAVALVAEYWRRMQSNDFAHAAALFGDDYLLDWPQSNERIRGRERFVRINAEYPAHGPWRFTVHRIVGDAVQAVSEVSVTDGVQSARAITFSEVRDGLIRHQTEFWPDPYPAPAGRSHLVEPLA